MIGSGIAGLAGAYELGKHHRVTLYEADARLGGHAHTHHLDRGDGQHIAVDSAFLVHNNRTYPTLSRIFGELGIATQDTGMSMSVRCEGCGLEYAGGRGLGGLFPAAANLARPQYHRMLAEIRRFHRAASRLLDDAHADLDLSEFLARQRFSPFFVDHFMVPLVAAVWSCPPQQALRYPSRYLFTFLRHHGMLTVFGSPRWRTVTGGSARYVDAIANRLDEVHTGTRVGGLRRLTHTVALTVHGVAREFDAAVVATHPDQALQLLATPTPAQRRVLGALTYTANHAVLHRDERVLPRRPRARASWNYLVRTRADAVAVSYDVTRLMRLPGPNRFLVTLGCGDMIDPRAVLDTMTYHHPAYTTEFVAAQRLLPTIDDDRVVFAGAYHGWGFHEDGAAAGVRAAAALQSARAEVP